MKKKQSKPAEAAAPPASSYGPNVTSGKQELRRQAEAKLKVKSKDRALPAANAVETQRLLHELQVHQIELEMQNDELVRSKAELEFTLSLYAELYAFAPVGYFTLTRDGTIRRANLTGAKLLGVGLAELIKKRFGTFVALSALITFSDFLDMVFTSDKKESCEVTLNKDGPAPFWVLIEAVVENSGGENEICYAIVSDICERKQTEAELRRQSTHDMLTGLYNYSFFMEELVRLERGRQFPVSIVMADVDHLKETNDHEGHPAGDAVLKRIAQMLTTAFRASDVIARTGGDEFAVLLPNTNTTAAADTLHRLQDILQKDNTAHPESPICISVGASTTEGNAPVLMNVLRQADELMYRQKREHKLSNKT